MCIPMRMNLIKAPGERGSGPFSFERNGHLSSPSRSCLGSLFLHPWRNRGGCVKAPPIVRHPIIERLRVQFLVREHTQVVGLIPSSGALVCACMGGNWSMLSHQCFSLFSSLSKNNLINCSWVRIKNIFLKNGACNNNRVFSFKKCTVWHKLNSSLILLGGINSNFTT